MKKESYKNILVFAIFAISWGLGAIVANTVIRYNEILNNGILGLAIWYLSYKVILSPNQERDSDDSGWAFELPKDIKFLLFGFLLTIVLYSATVQIIRMILSFIRS